MKKLVIAAFVASPLSLFGAQKFNYPKTKQEPLTINEFGMSYPDSFRWLENPHDPNLSQWVNDQNTFTQSYLGSQLLQELEAEFQNLLDDESLKNVKQNWSHKRKLQRIYVPGSLKQAEDSLSPDGRHRITLSSDSGSDLKILRIYSEENGTYTSDLLKVKFPGFVWDASGDSFLYTSDLDGRLGSHFPQVRRHYLGKKQSEDRVLYTAPTPDTWLSLVKLENCMLLYIGRGDQHRFHDFDPATGRKGELVWGSDHELKTLSEYQNKLYFISYENASNGKVIALDLKKRTVHEVVPEKQVAIDEVSLNKSDMFITYIDQAAHILFHQDLNTGAFKQVAFEGEGSLSFEDGGEKSYFTFSSYSEPSSRWWFDRNSFSLRLEEKSPPALIELESFRTYYHSITGRKAPIWIIKAKNMSLGQDSPVYLYGYGRFRVNIMPYFIKQYLPWLKRGGVIAVATLPGGLEFGEDWHLMGARENKMNVFHDFARAGKHLIHMGITSTSKLAIGGGSNGGLLVGATVNEYPQLFGAAVPEVGVLDMTRFELFTGGKWWTNEYGSRKNCNDLKNMLRVSPYHNIKSTTYPPILTMTADLDDRVVPSHSYKYAAMLQANDTGGQVALLYTKKGGSHSSSSGEKEQVAKYYAHKWAFLMKSLKIY